MRLKNSVKKFNTNTLEVFAQNGDKNKIKEMFFSLIFGKVTINYMDMKVMWPLRNSNTDKVLQCSKL